MQQLASSLDCLKVAFQPIFRRRVSQLNQRQWLDSQVGRYPQGSWLPRSDPQATVPSESGRQAKSNFHLHRVHPVGVLADNPLPGTYRWQRVDRVGSKPDYKSTQRRDHSTG
jgi:hypothetical protein